jgi:ketosteroid isomerase-like protein
MEGDQTFSGVPAIREFMAPMQGSAPPKFTVEKIVAEGDSAICYGKMSMEGAEEYAGKYSYCDAYTFADGKVTELRSFIVKHKTEGEKSGTAAG